MSKFIIYDWAGNRKFPEHDFEYFEDAWVFLYERFESDEDLDEFYVEEVEA